jgi:DNA-cytosine methyltransferase
MAKRPVGIDLFAGAGGLSLGFEQAGFDVVAAVEIDPIHSAIHKFNFPDCAVIPKSIKDLTGKAIRKESGIGQRKVDVVFGGPPCQGFSLMGGRAIDDPRNSLVVEFVRIVSELDASYFLFENVKGLTIGKHRKFLEEVIVAFDQAGYQVLLPWKVLNAANYGVPQDRQRLFLVGAKKGKPLPDYPEPTHRRPKSADNSLPLSPTCQEAIDDVPNAEDFKTLLLSDEVQTKAWGKPSPYARKMRCLDLAIVETGTLQSLLAVEELSIRKFQNGALVKPSQEALNRSLDFFVFLRMDSQTRCGLEQTQHGEPLPALAQFITPIRAVLLSEKWQDCTVFPIGFVSMQQSGMVPDKLVTQCRHLWLRRSLRKLLKH